MKIGFGKADITPALGSFKIGSLQEYRAEQIADPLHARAAVIQADDLQLAWITLDILSIRWTTCQRIRRLIEERFAFPGRNIMICATHNHGGPAVCHIGTIARDEAYITTMVERACEAFGTALAAARPASLGLAQVSESALTGNRRLVLHDGSVRTHATVEQYPDARGPEGPTAPEVTVLAARDEYGRMLGALVHFTCHVTSYCNDSIISADFPGALDRALAAEGIPLTLFLNGAAGNQHVQDVMGRRPVLSPEQIGERLAADALGAIRGMRFAANLPLGVSCETVHVPYRRPSAAEIDGSAPGTQRFGAQGIYAVRMPQLLARIEHQQYRPADVQVFAVGDYRFVAVPAELFVEYGLQLSRETAPLRTVVVGYANGMVGYIVTPEAMKRGGYETTFGEPSSLDPQAGAIICDSARRQIGRA